MPSSRNNPNPNENLSVSQLNRLAKQLLEDCFSRVQVVGELSNLSRPSSGHWYFTLKDERAQIRCAMFRSRNMAVRFQPQVGQQLLLTGKVSLYEGRGDYQLIVDTMQPAGAGALAMAFEQLKQELLAAGWFDQQRKRPLPENIRHIAIITSPTGAAIHDVLSVLERRWPAMRVTLVPSQVQGEAAAAQLAAAVELCNRLVHSGEQDFDLILLTRGGGSLEDLWPFNERRVAAAVHDSQLPVVSAVGHEVDVSIADFVADVRAPTPSAAAELISPDRAEISLRVSGLQAAVVQMMRQRVQQLQQQCRSLTQRLRHPGQLLREQSQRLDERELRLGRAMKSQLRQQSQQLLALQRRLEALKPQRQLQQQGNSLAQLQRRLALALRQQLKQESAQIDALTRRLRSLSPEGTLLRGYAIVTDDQGKLVTDSGQLESGERIHARLAQGQFSATVESTEKKDQ